MTRNSLYYEQDPHTSQHFFRCHLQPSGSPHPPTHPANSSSGMNREWDLEEGQTSGRQCQGQRVPNTLSRLSVFFRTLALTTTRNGFRTPQVNDGTPDASTLLETGWNMETQSKDKEFEKRHMSRYNRTLLNRSRHRQFFICL